MVNDASHAIRFVLTSALSRPTKQCAYVQKLDLTPDQERRAAGTLLPSELQMDVVTLAVGDLTSMVNYYRDALGLAEMTDQRHHTSGEPATVILGRGSTPLVALQHRPGLPRASRRAAGLFHTASLFPTQAELAATVLRAAQHPLSQFVGSSDHLVSEAFYFTDPEGNGIELYWDRPRDAWTWSDGQVAMDTIYLDPNRYLTEHLSGASA